jgi:hypothetical protein
VLYQFDQLELLASESRDRPVFALVHVPIPHLPLVLDREGDVYPLGSRDYDAPTPATMGLTDEAFDTALRDEIAYLNDRTLAAVDAHMAGAREPVFIVMSDHGWPFENADEADRLANLIAAYTPAAPDLLARATPANLMAIILNEYLDADVRIVENRFFRSPLNPFDFLQMVEISDPEDVEAGAR